jgi:cytochrome c556
MVYSAYPWFAFAQFSVTNSLPLAGGERPEGCLNSNRGIMMSKRAFVVAVIGALAAGAIVSGATVALAQADVIKQRQDNRETAGKTLKEIKGVLDAKGDAKSIVAMAAKLKELETAFDKLFPKGSDQGAKTAALPVIWTDMDGFLAASKAASAAYDKLAVAAGSGDLAAVQAAFADTGKACGACHAKYRAKPQ